MFHRTLLLCLVFAGSPAVAVEPTYPPGSRIGLVPPDGMAMSRGLAGFRNPTTGAAIATIEMPAEAYPSIAASFTEDALKAQGFTAKVRESRMVGKNSGLLVSGEQKEGQIQSLKSILIVSDPTMTVLVIGQLPATASPADIAKVEDALRTVTLRPPLPMNDQLAALPFRIGDPAGFRPVRAIAGNSLLMTDGPSDVVKEAEQPIVILAQSLTPPPPVEQRDAFARQVLIGNTFVKDPVFERSQNFRQKGQDWHELVARAIDGHSGNPVVVMQTIRFDPDGFMRMVGVVRADQRELVLPRFRKVVDSVSVQ